MKQRTPFFLVILVALLLGSVFTVLPALAQGPPGNAGKPGFTNPLGENVTVVSFLTRITNWLLGLVGFLALLALVVGGIWMIVAFGNEQRVEKGKEIVKWAVIGLIIVTLSYAVIKILEGFLGVSTV